jgi:tRNA 5-methylaminomethyl-2-thiouridine biosynthesis bifunctional protein
MYDFIVIGGGIAGSSIAYFLSKNGKSVAIIEQGGLASGASGAAGAFINPTMGRPSALKELHDKAFAFTVENLVRDFSHIYNQCGTLLLPKIEKSAEEFRSQEGFNAFSQKYLPKEELGFLRPEAAKFGAFMCRDSGVINPQSFCKELTAGCVVHENTHAQKISKVDGGYEVCGAKGMAVIVATGASKELLPFAYIRYGLIGLWGQKIEVDGAPNLKFNISGNALVSTYLGDRFAIGATYTRSETALGLTDKASQELIDKAKMALDVDIKEIKAAKGGLRSTSIDHFPIIGAVVDEETTLTNVPAIKTGSKTRDEQIARIPGLYVFTGHGSKAFTLAFYTAKLFADSLTQGKPLEKGIENSRIFIKWARKIPQPNISLNNQGE